MNAQVSSIHFDGWTLRTQSGELVREAQVVRLQEQPLQVLLALLEQPGEVVSREALIARLWPKGIIDYETGLNTAVRKLRAALHDDSEAPRYIETIPRRGYRFIAQLDQPKPATTAVPSAPSAELVSRSVAASHASSWVPRAAAVLILGAVALVAARWVSRSPNAPTTSESSLLPDRTIAVLPFEDLSRDRSDQLLAAGVAESILHQLSGLQQLSVISRSSSFALQGKQLDVREIGRRLNARFVLEGSLQREQNQMRITAQLIDASSGNHVWSVKFDRPVADVFAIQDEIALKVAQALKVTLDSSVEQRLTGQGTQDIDAYLAYLRGRRAVATFRSEDVEAAIDHYKGAIELDANFSAAYSGLAAAKVRATEHHRSDQFERQWRQVQTEAYVLVQRALELDPENADAYEVLALLEDDQERMEINMRRALELQPNSARAQLGLADALAWKSIEGDPRATDERLRHLQRAMELDPLEPLYPTRTAVAYLYQRTDEIERVEPLLRRALALDANFFPALIRLGELRYCCQARLAEGIKFGEQALRVDPSSTLVRNFLVHMYLAIGDDLAAEALAGDDPDSIVRSPIFAHRHQWAKAARAFYANRNDQAPPDNYVFPVLMDAVSGKRYQRAIDFLEQFVTLGASGIATCRIPMGTDCYIPIALAQLYQLNGEPARARVVLERVLETMNMTAVTYKRGNLWFWLSRTRALALLGRDGEALEALDRLSIASGMVNHWREFAIDPAFDRIRQDARFARFMSDQGHLVAAQAEILKVMRREGIVPQRTKTRR
jgi:TolB-like protein/DNA-binding winged helix-turn-helix (wHTH) protein